MYLHYDDHVRVHDCVHALRHDHGHDHAHAHDHVNAHEDVHFHVYHDHDYDYDYVTSAKDCDDQNDGNLHFLCYAHDDHANALKPLSI